MSLSEAEVEICNQALNRIGSQGTFTSAVQTSNEAVKCNLHYEQTRDLLQRSFEWNFCSARAELVILKTLTLDVSPYPDAWAVGDVITGISSCTTATVISVTNNLEYEIAYLSGDFTDGETITNGDVEVVAWEGIPLEYEDETVLWYDDQSSDDVKCGTGYPVIADSTPDFEWDYQYVLPSDFSRFKMIWRREHQHWTIEGDRLLTDDDEAYVEYIKKVTDPTDFDPIFAEVLILTLAKKLIPSLAGTKNPELVAEVNRDLTVAMARAKAICKAEANDTGRSDWNLARYGSGIIHSSRK